MKAPQSKAMAAEILDGIEAAMEQRLKAVGIKAGDDVAEAYERRFGRDWHTREHAKVLKRLLCR